MTSYAPRDVYFLELDCGENERAALDYLLHYRSPHMIGLDADYAMSRAYHAQSWPTFVVVDAHGIIRYHGHSDRELADVRRCLEQLLTEPAGASGGKPALDQGIAYPAEVLAARRAARERSPRLAFDGSGNAHVVYYSNRDGTNAVYVRHFDFQGKRRGDVRVSAPGVESYGADCVFDSQGALWIAWCGRQSDRYDIYIQRRAEGREPLTERLATRFDDSMSPRLAAGPDGAVMVVYYQWRSLRGVSRDRDVYARTFDRVRNAWAPEVEISPHEPQVEDHTDPDVALDREGRACIGWSYDYHPQLFKQPVQAAQPTIFAATLETNNVVSTPILVGATGRNRHAVDLFPTLAADGQGTLWCAWDCSEPSRCIRVSRFDPAAKHFVFASMFGRTNEVCSTPELSMAGTNRMLLAWSQRADDSPAWQGRVVLLRDGKPAAESTIAEPVDVLFPQAQQAPDGKVWVVYEKSAARGSEIALRDMSAQLKPNQ